MGKPFVVIEKDANAILDYQLSWASWLPSGDTISTHSWTTAAGITLSTASNSTQVVTFWLSGGTANQKYELVNRIVTASGRQDERTIIIEVTDR